MATKKTVSGPENPELAAAAVKGVTNDRFPLKKTYCQKFVRLAVEDIYGLKYDNQNEPTAEESRQAYIKAGLSVPVENGSVVGDILYKSPTPKEPRGHVGIRVPGNKVAENSSTHIGRVSGAKGYRSLSEFGRVLTIVRLPRRK